MWGMFGESIGGLYTSVFLLELVRTVIEFDNPAAGVPVRPGGCGADGDYEHRRHTS